MLLVGRRHGVNRDLVGPVAGRPLADNGAIPVGVNQVELHLAPAEGSPLVLDVAEESVGADPPAERIPTSLGDLHEVGRRAAWVRSGHAGSLALAISAAATAADDPARPEGTHP